MRHPLAMTLLLLAVPACDQAARSTHAKPSAHELMVREGQKAFARNDFKAAIDYFNKALAERATDPVALAGRGRCYLENKQWDEAIADFDAAVALTPKDGPSYLYRGLAYAEKEDQSRALRDCKKAAELGTGDANPDAELAAVFARHGVQYHRAKNQGKAIEFLELAIKHDPQNPQYQHRLGLVYSSQEDWDKAIKLMTHALKLGGQKAKINSDLATAHLGRARREREANHDAQARADFEAAVRLEPAFLKHAREFYQK